MNSSFVTDSIAAVSSELKVWPKDVTFYGPLVDNFLMVDVANTKASQGLLRLHGLSYTVQGRENAEFMTASGSTPFLRIGNDIVEKEGLLKFLQMKGFSFIQDFPDDLKLRALSYLSIIEEVIVSAELYFTWIDSINVTQTQSKYGHGRTQLLGSIIFKRKQHKILSYLTALNWHKKTETQVVDQVRQCLRVFAQKLEDTKFLLGDSPCEVDVVLVGHLSAILQYKQPNPTLESTINKFPRLIDYCRQFILEGTTPA